MQYNSNFMDNAIKKDVGTRFYSSNGVKLLEDSIDTTEWYVKKVDEQKAWKSALPELFGSAIHTYFLGNQHAPYNIIVKSSGISYLASKKIENFEILDNGDPAAFKQAKNLNFATALAIFTGTTSGSEWKNMGVIQKETSTYVTNIDFQNNNYLVNHIYNEYSGRENRCESFEILNQGKFSFGVTTPTRDTLKEELIKLSKVSSSILGNLIYNKFSEFQWYLDENNLDIMTETHKYIRFIEDTKSCIQQLYSEQFAQQDLYAAMPYLDSAYSVWSDAVQFPDVEAAKILDGRLSNTYKAQIDKIIKEAYTLFGEEKSLFDAVKTYFPTSDSTMQVLSSYGFTSSENIIEQQDL